MSIRVLLFKRENCWRIEMSLLLSKSDDLKIETKLAYSTRYVWSSLTERRVNKGKRIVTLRIHPPRTEEIFESSLFWQFFFTRDAHILWEAQRKMQNARRWIVLNDLMIKPILTCITGMSNTDFIPATPRIVASVIVCSFAFYCYVCIYERTFSCFFFVKKSKLVWIPSLIIWTLWYEKVCLLVCFLCAHAQERERESFVSFQSIAFLLSRFVLLLFAGALSSFIGRGIDFVSLSRRFSFPHPSSAENLRESTFLF